MQWGEQEKPKNSQELKRDISYWEREERNKGIPIDFYVHSEVEHIFDYDSALIEIWPSSSNIVSKFSV